MDFTWTLHGFVHMDFTWISHDFTWICSRGCHMDFTWTLHGFVHMDFTWITHGLYMDLFTWISHGLYMDLFTWISHEFHIHFTWYVIIYMSFFFDEFQRRPCRLPLIFIVFYKVWAATLLRFALKGFNQQYYHNMSFFFDEFQRQPVRSASQGPALGMPAGCSLNISALVCVVGLWCLRSRASFFNAFTLSFWFRFRLR